MLSIEIFHENNRLAYNTCITHGDKMETMK